MIAGKNKPLVKASLLEWEIKTTKKTIERVFQLSRREGYAFKEGAFKTELADIGVMLCKWEKDIKKIKEEINEIKEE